MNATVIIPVGPGHKMFALEAAASVHKAWDQSRGPFKSYDLFLVDDHEGKLGRSRARNRGLDQNPADWHFLLDADDEMRPYAFDLVDLNAAATFGAVCLAGKTSRENMHPVTRETLLKHGALGTLSMGCWLRGDLGLRFDETLDVAEDFDFYLRLPGFTKRREALVSIGYFKPSAGGPRGYRRVDWVGECNAVIAKYRNSNGGR